MKKNTNSCCIFCLGLLFMITACQTPESRPGHIHTAELPRLQPELELVISDSDDVLFMQLDELTTDRQGNIFVSDQGTLQIHMFNSDGDFIGSVGGRGAGPGEFQYIYNILTDGNGRLFANDPRQGRSMVFAEQNGEWGIQQIITGNGYAIESAGPDGELIFRQSPPQAVEPGLFWFEHELATGTVEDGVVHEQVLMFKAENILVKDDQMMQWMPIQWRTIVSRAPDGSIYMIWNDQFEIAVYDPALNFVDSLKAAIPNQPIGQDERRELLEERFLPDLRALARQHLPEAKPVIENMFVDSDKNMWLQTYDSPEYLVLDAKGNAIGSFDLPEELLLAHADSGKLYAIKSGDMGYEIQVFKVDL